MRPHTGIQPYIDAYGFKRGTYQLLNEGGYAIANVSFCGPVTERVLACDGVDKKSFVDSARRIFDDTKPIVFPGSGRQS